MPHRLLHIYSHIIKNGPCTWVNTNACLTKRWANAEAASASKGWCTRSR